MQEVRCKKCGHLLGKFKGEAEIKCKNCKTINYVSTERQECQLPQKG
ncbi:MAG: Com family DNA-binding transcriptional regulator [Oscillospiraceae bacterium]